MLYEYARTCLSWRQKDGRNKTILGISFLLADYYYYYCYYFNLSIQTGLPKKVTRDQQDLSALTKNDLFGASNSARAL